METNREIIEKIAPTCNVVTEDFTKQILEELRTAKKCLAEIEVMQEKIKFLINEYRNNPRYFREESGKVTIEDVIRTSFEYGWQSNVNYQRRNNNESNNRN